MTVSIDVKERSKGAILAAYLEYINGGTNESVKSAKRNNPASDDKPARKTRTGKAKSPAPKSRRNNASKQPE